MSANRKLQSNNLILNVNFFCNHLCYLLTLAEIQQVMKKVEEGLLMFEDIWDKVYAADQQNLKVVYLDFHFTILIFAHLGKI
jgi:hypothetical protein